MSVYGSRERIPGAKALVDAEAVMPGLKSRPISGAGISAASIENFSATSKASFSGASVVRVPGPRVTAGTLLEKKRAGVPISALTAYDWPTARLVDEAGIDVVLVGDSLGMVVLGYENTLPVTMEEMLHHTRAVARGVRRAFLVADMPYGAYHTSGDVAVENALRFVKEAGAQAVKIEGGAARAELVRRMTEAEVCVVGHIGLTPQSVHGMGGYKVQGKTTEAMERLRGDAWALKEAGAVAIVLEGIPRELAARITTECGVPTIGIGAGPECDGQILVFHDVFGLTFGPRAKFVRQYGDAAGLFAEGLKRYREDVAGGRFPSDEESYHAGPEVKAGVVGEVGELVARKA